MQHINTLTREQQSLLHQVGIANDAIVLGYCLKDYGSAYVICGIGRYTVASLLDVNSEESKLGLTLHRHCLEVDPSHLNYVTARLILAGHNVAICDGAWERGVTRQWQQREPELVTE